VVRNGRDKRGSSKRTAEGADFGWSLATLSATLRGLLPLAASIL